MAVRNSNCRAKKSCSVAPLFYCFGVCTHACMMCTHTTFAISTSCFGFISSALRIHSFRNRSLFKFSEKCFHILLNSSYTCLIRAISLINRKANNSLKPKHITGALLVKSIGKNAYMFPQSVWLYCLYKNKNVS